MKTAHFSRRLFAGLILMFLAASSAFGSTKTDAKRKIEFTTSSKEAKEYVSQIVFRVETFQFGPDVTALAKKSVEVDPSFAFGYYLLATTSPTPEEAKANSDKAVEFAKKASDGERRYI